MRARDYVDMELKQLYNENDIPHVSERSRSNPFYEGGVDIEEIDDDEPPKKQGILKRACSYIPRAKQAIDIAERGCKLMGNGCPMCCGGKRGKHTIGGCIGCPYCHGKSWGGTMLGGMPRVFVHDFTSNINVPYPTSQLSKINFSMLMGILRNRYGISNEKMAEKDAGYHLASRARKKIIVHNKQLALWHLFTADRRAFIDHLDKVHKPLLQLEYKPEQSSALVPQEERRIISTIDSRFFKTGIPPEVLQGIPEIIAQTYDLVVSPEAQDILNIARQKLHSGLSSASQFTKSLISAIKKEATHDIKTVKQLSPSAHDVVKIIEHISPSSTIEEFIEADEDVEQLKKVINETYKECLARFPKGQKQINCVHLTKKYVSGKINEIDVRKLYHTYGDCMKNTEKGQKRKRCYPLTKKAHSEKKEDVRSKTKMRNKKIYAHAKKLKSKHPELSYLDRVKMARRIVQ